MVEKSGLETDRGTDTQTHSNLLEGLALLLLPFDLSARLLEPSMGDDLFDDLCLVFLFL